MEPDLGPPAKRRCLGTGVALFPNSHDQVIHRVDATCADRDIISQPVGSPVFNLHYNFSGEASRSLGVESPAPRPQHTPSTVRPPERDQTSEGGILRTILNRFLRDRTVATKANPVDPHDTSSTSGTRTGHDTHTDQAQNADHRGGPTIDPFGETADFEPANTLSKAEAYVHSMLSSGEGLACWKPGPRHPIRDGEGIVPGDVGRYTAGGGFRKMFNLWDDEDLIQATAASAGLSYQIPQKQPNCENENEYLAGDTVVQGTTAKTLYQADGQLITGFEFRHLPRHARGGILAVTSQAKVERLSDTERNMLFQHITRNAEVLFRHASDDVTPDGGEGLYIPTSCVKSESWALAGFCDPMVWPDNTLRLIRRQPKPVQPPSFMVPGRGALPPFMWAEKGTADGSAGVSKVKESKDQSLFLKGYKLDSSSSFRNGVNQEAVQAASSSGHGGSGSGSSGTSRPDTGGPGSGSGGRPSSGGGEGSSPSARPPPASNTQGLCDTEMTVTHFPEFDRSDTMGKSVHPCDLINSYLLDETGSDFALSHDDDWIPLLRDSLSDGQFGSEPPRDTAVDKGVSVVRGEWGPDVAILVPCDDILWSDQRPGTTLRARTPSRETEDSDASTDYDPSECSTAPTSCRAASEILSEVPKFIPYEQPMPKRRAHRGNKKAPIPYPSGMRDMIESGLMIWGQHIPGIEAFDPYTTSMEACHCSVFLVDSLHSRFMTLRQALSERNDEVEAWAARLLPEKATLTT